MIRVSFLFNIDTKKSRAAIGRLAGTFKFLLAALVLALATSSVTAATFNVTNVSEFLTAVNTVNGITTGATHYIVMAPGVYALSGTVTITNNDVTLIGDSTSPTVLIPASTTNSLITFSGRNGSMRDIMLQPNGTIFFGNGVTFRGVGNFVASGLTITGALNSGFRAFGGGTATLINSTIAANQGAGIAILDASLDLINVTISDNNSGLSFSSSGQAMILTNALVARNVVDCTGSSISPGAVTSIDSDGTCVALGFGTNLGMTTHSASSIVLGSLSNNGGPLLTESIFPPSNAINAGANSPGGVFGLCPATDQRGIARNDGACDIGAYEFGSVTANTLIGINRTVSPLHGVTVDFNIVTENGNTTATPIVGPPPPAGFQVDGNVFDISTTASYTPPVTVCLPFDPTVDPSPAIFHFEDPNWVDRTTSVDSVHGIVCGTVSSLSPFGVLMPGIAPTPTPSPSPTPTPTPTLTPTVTPTPTSTPTPTPTPTPTSTPSVESQINSLIGDVLNSSVSLRIKVRLTFELLEALGEFRQGDVGGACQEMQDFITLVNGERGRGISNSLADRWIAAAEHISSAIRCTQGPAGIINNDRPPALKFDSVFFDGQKPLRLPWSNGDDG